MVPGGGLSFKGAKVARFALKDLVSGGIKRGIVKALAIFGIGVAKKEVPLILKNRAQGLAAEREIGALFEKAGYTVDYNVGKRTPFGWRRIDVQLSKDGRVLGGLEIKTGNSPYTPSQRAKDYYLKRWVGYVVNLVPLG